MKDHPRRPPPAFQLQIWALRKRAAEEDLAHFCSIMGIRYAPMLRIDLGEYNSAIAGLFLPDFGGPQGLLINADFRGAADYHAARPHRQGFWDAGFGHCRLSGRPPATFPYYRAMLRTIGWTGPAADMPEWLALPSDNAGGSLLWLDHEWNGDRERVLSESFATEASPSRRTPFGAVFGWLGAFPPPHLAEEADWAALAHQAGGLSCQQVSVSGLPISMTPGFSSFAAALCATYEFSLQGNLYPPVPAEIFEGYRGKVAAFGLTVSDDEQPNFMEAVYPIDLREAEIARVTDLPEALLRLLHRGATAPSFPPPRLYIIAENSD